MCVCVCVCVCVSLAWERAGRRDIYADAVPSRISDAVRSFKGAASVPVMAVLFSRPFIGNMDCLSSEVAAAVEHLRALGTPGGSDKVAGCSLVRFVAWGGPDFERGSLSKEQAKIVDNGAFVRWLLACMHANSACVLA